MKWMTALAFTALLAGSAAAQSKNGEVINVAQAAERLTTRMTDELGLSPEQAQQVNAVNVKYMEKTMVMRDAKDETVDGLDKAGLLAARDQELKGVLTADQFTKMMSMQGAGPAKATSTKEVKPAAPVK
ncbi:MAG: hypothetical protein KBH07_08580 [Flavobacteriales bacterium]|nr:hypothetical protein [Flavobacteriales bacterium]MBP9079249.1 hypothetical protein [Flavobacteriales bacterium]